MCVCSMRTLSLIVGWFHLIFSAVISITLLVYLCIYNNKTYDETEIEVELTIIGLHTLLIMFLFSVACVIFDVLLLKGISNERVKLMSPFVYGNYFLLGLITVSTIITLLADIIAVATFGDIMIHFVVNAVFFGITLLLFWPIRVVYKEMQKSTEQAEQLPLKNIGPVKTPNYIQGDDV